MGEFSICLFSTIFDKILRQHRTNASAARWRVVSPFRAVWKTGNTPRIPLFSKPSAEEKSRATGSCRIVRCCPKDSFRNRLSSFLPVILSGLTDPRGKTSKTRAKARVFGWRRTDRKKRFQCGYPWPPKYRRKKSYHSS